MCSYSLSTYVIVPSKIFLYLVHVEHSVAYVSRSGGMSNELNNIISHTTNGVYEGVAIGGDRWVGGHMIVM